MQLFGKALLMTRHWSGAALLSCVLAVSPGAIAQTLVLKGGSVYASPEATPIADAVIVTSAGTITAAGRAGEVQVPPDARVIDCSGKTIVAGFWNSHVHLLHMRGKRPRRQRAGGAAYRAYAGD